MIPFGFGNKNKFIMMKDQSGPKSSKRWILIILLVGICAMSSTISSQGKINIGIGADLLEYYNISLRYQGVQTQFALGIGKNGFNNEYENRLSISASVYYHFDGISSLTSRRLWYGKITINYIKHDYSYNRDELIDLTAGLRVGRDFNLSEKLGLNADIGFNFGKISGIRFYPSAGIWLFYRI